MLKVFVSSTSLDLKNHREAIRTAMMRLQMYPVMMEDFNATDAAALEKCKREVMDSDVFVGIYAYRYGYIPPNQSQSITELEYVWATERKLPRLVFIVDPAASWDDALKDTDPVSIGLLAAFKKRLDRETVRATFTTPDDLAVKVVTSLAEMDRENRIKPRQQQQQRLIIAGLIALIFMAIAAAALYSQNAVKVHDAAIATQNAQIALNATLTATAYTPTPRPTLENASFNVAVAEFVVQSGTSMKQSEADQLLQAFIGNLKTNINLINPELSGLGGTIGIWEPSVVGKVEGETSKEREENAQTLLLHMRDDRNARVDLLIYGVIQQNGDQIELIPSFYNAYESPELAELFGRFDLDAALAPTGAGAVSSLTVQLTDRAKMLALITQGIVLSVVSPPRYDKAETTFKQVLSVDPDNKKGKALIYILIGNSIMSEYNRLAAIGSRDDMERRTDLLAQAQQNFDKAAELNPNYARAYAGLGAVLYQLTLSKAAGPQAWSSIPDSDIQAIEDTFKQAATATDSPTTADIPTKVNFGLGEAATLRFLAGDDTQADVALMYFDKVTTEYGEVADPSNPRVREFAAQAYGFIGLIRGQQNQTDESVAAYDQAIALTQLDVRKLVFQRAELYVKIEDRRLSQDIAGALDLYTALFKFELQPDEAASAYFSEGKMLSEAGRAGDALQAYETGIKLEKSISPVLAARLWAEIGNKRCELKDLLGCSDAYQHAIDLDAQGQGHLQKNLDTIQQEMKTASPAPR